MPGIGLLHGIHRERANGVYAKLIKSALMLPRCVNGAGRCQFEFGWHIERILAILQTDAQSHPAQGEVPLMLNPVQTLEFRPMMDDSP
jgi:hypothetical protein